jgi:VWFA-related protein
MCAFHTSFFQGSSRAAIVFLPVLMMFPSFLPAQAAPGTALARGGQDAVPSASADSSGGSSLNTTVDEVSLDLAVRAKHNKPILDLQPSQLTVTDAGTPVQLSSLRLVAADSRSQHLVALVFDRLDPNSAKIARKMAEKVLGVFPDKGYTFAVFQINGPLRLLQPYTPDRGKVDAALVEATPSSPVPPSTELTPAEKAVIAGAQGDSLTVDAADRAADKVILSALEQSHQMLEERRSNPSLVALQALVLGERVVSGRKFILYFSKGISPSSDARDTLHSIVGLSNRAGVTICVMDANPLDLQMGSAMQASVASSILGQGGNAFGIGSTPGNGGVSTGPGQPGAGFGLNAVHDVSGFQFGDVDTRESPLVSLAMGTDGIYIRPYSSSKHGLQQFHEDLSSWYQASWVPPIKNYDGQFRAIDIHSPRKGLVIRARSGYFAVPATDTHETRPFEMPLVNILAGSALPTDIAFHAGILRLGELAGGNSSELTVQVPVSQLQIHEDANTHISSVHAAIVAEIKDSKGNVLERFGEDYPLHETPEILQGDRGRTITMQQHFSADPGVYSLDAAVMDRIANKAGAQRITFTIEAVPQNPTLSDIALVEGVEPTEQDNETFEPMRYGDGYVIRNMAGELAEDTRSLSLFFLVHPVAGSQSQPELRMQISRNGKLLTEMPLELQKVSGTGAAIPYLGSIHGKSIPPGNYEVKALLSQDGRTASNSVSFRVEGNSAAANSNDSSLTGAGSPSGKESASDFDAAGAGNLFLVTSPTNPVPPPTDAEIQAMIEGARKRALAWTDSLENFLCFEVTDHSVDATGHGDWKHKDTLVELMRYVDHQESRTAVLLNGDRTSVQPDRLEFMHSAGEFGAMFHIIFNPSAKAEFTWKRSALVDGQLVQVFAFKVARANSGFDIAHNYHDLYAGFHGLLYLEPATLSVRNISIEADDIPAALHVRASSMSVDYSWIAMQDHDFLLPVHGAVSLTEANKRPVLNEFEFHNYHRFGSQTRILTDDELKSQSKN